MKTYLPGVGRRPGIDLALAAGGGLVASAAFPPVGFGVLVVVGLLPLLWIWRHAGIGRSALCGFAWGITYYVGIMYWIWLFGAIAIVPLVALFAGWVAATGALVGVLRRFGVSSPWVTAAVWIVVEAVRGRFPWGGLAWGDIGLGFAGMPVALDVARWGGAALVGFLVVAGAGLLVETGEALRERARRARVMGALTGLGAIVVVVVVASLTATKGPATGELRFALVQGNDLNRELTPDEISERYIPWSHFALAETIEDPVDLIVLPESSMDRDPRTDPELEDAVRDLAAAHDAAVMVNAGVFEDDGRSFNTNILYGPDGAVVGTYAKQRLVPFGEFVPLEDQLSWIPALENVPNRYTPGTETVVLDVAGIPVGTVICFENAFPDIMRASARAGAEAIVLTTNNRSYERSSNAAQHVNLSRMRAAETGRPILHASISGITAVVDADGSVLSESELFVNSVTEGTITTRGGQTPFVRWGHWIVWASVLILVGATVLAWRRRTPAAESGTVESPRAETGGETPSEAYGRQS